MRLAQEVDMSYSFAAHPLLPFKDLEAVNTL